MVVMSLPITNGLVGWYKGMTWNGISWPDLSGNGNDCTETRGTVRKTFDYIYGGTGDGIRFPVGILPSTYTLFHVARYNGSSKGRIFDGTAGNWLSGFHGNKTGVAFHDGWLTSNSTTNFPLDEILISTDQKRLYRGNGIDLTINSVTGSNKQLSINYGYYTDERSDWAVWEVIVYDRELSLEEIKFVESYLSHYIHPYTNPVMPRGVNYFNPRDIVFYKQTGYYTKINQMTGNTTNMPGFGDVMASASSTLNNSTWEPWKAFNGTTLSDFWHSELNYSNGTYTGSASLGGYPGEWLKIEFPVAVFLNYSVLYARYIPDDWTKRLVKTGYLIASNDNTNWSVVQYINRTPEAYTETSFVLVDKYIQKPFKYYAVVATELFALSSVNSIQISEWYMDVKIPEFQINNPYLLFMDFDYWYIIFNRQSSANWTIEQSGSNPDVFLKLNDYGTRSSYTYLWYELRIQDYDYLHIEFEYSMFGVGDGTTFKIGCLTAGDVGGEHIRAQAFNVNMQIYNGVNKFRIYKNGVVKIAETSLIKAASDGAYAWTPVKIIYNKGTYKTWTIYHNNTLLVEYDDSDNDFFLSTDSGSFFGFGSRTGAATANQEIRRFKMIAGGDIQPNMQDGSTPLRAAYSASRIVENFPELGDGVYWINLPEVGPTQVYCILNTDCAGGGWMLAMN